MAKAKVMLVSPYSYTAKEINEPTQFPPVGLAYVAAYLESKGVECSILDANLYKLGHEEMFSKVEAYNPDIVGISVNIVFIKEVIRLSKDIKKRLNKTVILGGPSSLGNLDYLLGNSLADCMVRGEGEHVFWNVVSNNAKNLEDIKGISFMKDGIVVSNPKEELIKDVDAIPFPAYHLLPDLKLYRSRSRKHPVATIVTSRGCPYSCVFCLSANTGWRPRSPENVLKEMEMLVEKYGVKQIDILDDNFTLEFKRAEKILDMIIEKKWKIAISFPNGVRADRLTENLVHKMKLAGVYRVGIGIESGRQSIVDGIKKSLKLEHVRECIKWFRKESIIVCGFFMFGLPGEDMASMEETIQFANEVDPHYANFGVTVPLPGTQLYKTLKDGGHLIEDTQEGITTGYYSIKGGHYSMGDLKPEDVLTIQKKAYKKFYFRPKKMLELALTIRSLRELKWTIGMSMPLLKGIFTPNGKKNASGH
ncbi:radical SAM protein [Candidatus Woesearchaeota archaeon]|nr:radical SAM protein [Candidatus Woesearchaeota archaeon]